MKEEAKRPNCVRTPSEVELQPKTRGHKRFRNSLAVIYNEATDLRKHKKLLGQEIQIDDNLEWRVKWSQRGAAVSCLLALVFLVAGPYIAFMLFAALGHLHLGILYYKNITFVVAKRLLRETKVVIILVLTLCNWSIDIARPAHSFSSLNGFLYALTVCAFVFLDAVKVKSRVFVIVIGIMFVLVTLNEIYDRTFAGWDQGVVLFKYTIQWNNYVFMKRSTKRSIFIQIMLFGMNGIYTLFKDRKQELMIFATGYIYRETGNAQGAEIDNGLEWRVKWGQRGAKRLVCLG